MNLDEARTFLKTHHRAVMTTIREDARPQMSPILIGVNSAGQGIVSSRETAYKVRNLRRDPRVYICVFTDKFYGKWIQVEGTAHILSLPDALEPLVDFYKTVVGEHPDWEDYRAAMFREKRVLIQISLEHVGPDRSG